MKDYKRVFVIVLDSLGIGAMPVPRNLADEGVDNIWPYLRENGKT